MGSRVKIIPRATVLDLGPSLVLAEHERLMRRKGNECSPPLSLDAEPAPRNEAWRRNFPPNKSQDHFNWRRSMSNRWTGRCLCGAMQYESRGDPLAQLICHCRDCQRASGSAGLPVIVVRATDFAFKGNQLDVHQPEIPQHLRSAP